MILDLQLIFETLLSSGWNHKLKKCQSNKSFFLNEKNQELRNSQIEIEFDKQNSEITWRGVYSRSDVKTGVWEIYGNMMKKLIKCINKYQLIIPCCEYDNQEHKMGQWIEQSDRFRYWNQSTSQGKYNKQGVRVEKWNLYWKYEGKIINVMYQINYCIVEVGNMMNKDEKLEKGQNRVMNFHFIIKLLEVKSIITKE
ncbi:unnamed protein product [Paramecium primaurelia]|uniref:Uncharacterized protein n=1 Tax=Paramecium primaurelia TaxID=5886 RepID=A0A8S1QIB5_PARPR|nr:unnamed protein product [Paramecium primaurelia]